jgi:acetyltransferase
LIQQQCSGGLELILGGKNEGETGSVLMIGAGGTGVEIYQDVKLCHVPVSSGQADKAITGLKCYPLLQGYRGKRGVNLEKLQAMISQLSQMLYELPEIKEIDMNPVVYEEETGCFKVLDCRIRV